MLVYLYAEPKVWASGKVIDPARIALHRKEVARFAKTVHGADVTFVPLHWADVLAQWAKDARLRGHAAVLAERFGPL